MPMDEFLTLKFGIHPERVKTISLAERLERYRASANLVVEGPRRVKTTTEYEVTGTAVFDARYVDLKKAIGPDVFDGYAYRYELRRYWTDQGNGRFVNWLMMNPSTADALTDDRTVARCWRFARRWGYSGIVVTNILAFRSAYPMIVRAQPDPNGPLNDSFIVSAAQECDLVIAAWGGEFPKRSADVVNDLIRPLGKPILCMGRTGKNEPRHPLYRKGDLIPEVFIA